MGERGTGGEGEMDIGENKLSHDKGHQRVGQKKKKKKCLLFKDSSFGKMDIG